MTELRSAGLLYRRKEAAAGRRQEEEEVNFGPSDPDPTVKRKERTRKGPGRWDHAQLLTVEMAW